jgi:beta-phosphoglucomutase
VRRVITPIDAIIFDMDGVIVDSEPLHERALAETLTRIGFPATPGMQIADYIGRSDQDFWKDFVVRFHPAQTLAELVRLKRDRVVELVREHQPLFTGLSELVAALAARWPLALASGSERPVIEAVLDIEGLRRHFRVVVSSAEVPRGKPAPDVFLLTAQRLGVSPAACVVIEDSKPGVAAALAAGMRVVAVTNTHDAEELGHATWTAGSCAAVGALLSELPGPSTG